MQPSADSLVSLVIVTWNSSKTLLECLNSVRVQTYKDVELIVVDNGSSDDSVQTVRETFPNATIITNPGNIGFCRGQNIGISASRGEFVMPLNPDVRMTPSFIEQMVRAMSNRPSIGIVAGKLLLPVVDPDTGLSLIDGTGLFIDKARRQYLRGHGEPDKGQYDAASYVFGACGAAPLYRRTMLEDIQIDNEYFDSSFFAHKEDLDISWRAQLLGWQAWYEPTAVAYHDRGFRPSRRRMMSQDIKMHAVKNRYLAIVKNDLMSNVLRHVGSILIYDLKIIGYISLFERSSFEGLSRFVHLLPDALRKRRIIMRRRRVPSKYIRAFFDG